MCGRFTLRQSSENLAQLFEIDVPSLEARYNIAPTQQIATVVQDSDGQQQQFRWMRWGLIPSWSKDSAIGNRLINARAETLTEKPSFRSGFKKRRCLILADGFYEWHQQEKGRKQPYFIHLNPDRPFAFAGIWEHWTGANGEEIDSTTIITTQANELLGSIHDRMPVILNPEDYECWLDRLNSNTAQLQSLLQPFPSQAMSLYPIRDRVNKPSHNDIELLQPLSIEN